MVEQIAPIPVDGRILFYSRDREAFNFLSNFYAASVTIDGLEWPTTEHFYQAQKSRDEAYRSAVRSAATPGQAKRLGTDPSLPARRSAGSWFRANGRRIRTDWENVKLDAMRTALRAKFAQHDELAARLLATDPAALVEDSGVDSFWGVGADGSGKNWLGSLLEELRRDLLVQGTARGPRNPQALDSTAAPVDQT